MLNDPERTGNGETHRLGLTCSITRSSRLWNWRVTAMSIGRKNSSLTSRRRTRITGPDQAPHLRSQTPEGVEQEFTPCRLATSWYEH